LWVRFLSPPRYKDKKLQLYPRSLEPHKGPGQGQDFSLLSELDIQYPSTLTLGDIGITERMRTVTTVALLQVLPTCHQTTGSSSDTTPVSDPVRVLPAALGHKKWNDNVLLYERLLWADSAPFELPCLSTTSTVPDENDDTGPPVYSRFTQDPSHRGEAMCHSLKPEWIKVENLEMTGLVRHKVWERVLRSSLQSYDKVFATRFHYKVKRKRGKLDKLKVRLVIQGQHMSLKDDNGKDDYRDAFSPVPHVSGLRILLVIPTENDMFTDHVDIPQAFTQGDLQPGDDYMANLYISAPPGFPEDPDYYYRLLKPLYDMPSVAHAWFQTMSTFLKQEGCSKVGHEESMWKTTVNCHDIVRYPPGCSH
jgi:hypothetical protein